MPSPPMSTSASGQVQIPGQQPLHGGGDNPLQGFVRFFEDTAKQLQSATCLVQWATPPGLQPRRSASDQDLQERKKVHFADVKTMKGLQHEALHRARSSQVGLSTAVQDEAVGDANLRMRRSSSSRASSSPAIAAAPAASAAPLNAGRRDSVAGRGAQDNRPTRGSSGSMAAPAAAPVSAGAQKPAIARSGSISSLNGLGAGAVQPSPPPRTLTPPGAAATERPRKLSLLGTSENKPPDLGANRLPARTSSVTNQRVRA